VRLRKIGAEEIEEAIWGGTVIESYPDDPRGPCCLILGLSKHKARKASAHPLR